MDFAFSVSNSRSDNLFKAESICELSWEAAVLVCLAWVRMALDPCKQDT